jgi:hypothetical protein
VSDFLIFLIKYCFEDTTLGKIIALNRSKVLIDDDSPNLQHSDCLVVYPDWHTRSLSYPTYYPFECLDKFSFEESHFLCKKCGSKALYYRFDVAFEVNNAIYIPNRVDLSFELLKKKGPPCFVLMHMLCCPFGNGCRSSWKLEGMQSMIEILSSELDEEWIDNRKSGVAII